KRLNEINKEISDIDTQLRILKNGNENKQQRKTLESRRKELIRERTSLIVPTRSYNLKFSF
ncbi:TPA: DNA repair protein, partial [Vibrio vulnificus]